MSLPNRPQARPGTESKLEGMACSNCRAPMNRFSPIWRLDRVVMESFGDPPNRVGRSTVLVAAVFDSAPCVAGWIADNYPSI